MTEPHTAFASRVDRLAPTIIPLLALWAVGAGCSSGSSRTGATGMNDAAAQIPDATPDRTADVAVVPPGSVLFPDAPDVACGGDAGECPLPPSACADPSCDGGACPGTQWVVYYDNPMCVSGQCVYTNRYFECSVSTTCSGGGCRFNGTTAAP